MTEHSVGESKEPWKEFRTGARDILPLLIGALPFGLIYGTLAVSAGLSPGAAIAMSALVFAGSAQFIAVGLVAGGTPLSIIILTTFIVNLRHMLYSASLLPELKKLTSTWRIILAFFLTDEAYAIAVVRYGKEDSSQYKHWYHLGASLAMYVNWQFWCFTGIMVGQNIPNAENWGLDFAMPVTFIGMIIPFVQSKPMIICVVTAGCLSLPLQILPFNLGLILSSLIGILTGISAERVGKIKKEGMG